MNRNKNRVNDAKFASKTKAKYVKKYDKKKKNAGGQGDRGFDEAPTGTDHALSSTGRDNNPNWYFLDAKLAEQISRLSFRQLAGMPMKLRLPGSDGTTASLPHVTQNMNQAAILAIALNPSPGVQIGAYGHGALVQRAGINLAGFRIFQKLSAFTGRKTDVYAPQDISTLILAYGEIISMVEWIRRVFGVFYTSSERNRTYPTRLLSAMRVNYSDMATNYSAYRTRFNAIITRLNALPIPKNIAYFDKCASLYEKVYLDAESPMATTILFNIHTYWSLNETEYEGGSILKTFAWTSTNNGAPGDNNPVNLSVFLNKLEANVDILANSTTFNVIYTDLLNMASKMNVEFWKFDYLLDGYVVMPEYNRNLMLQIHNMTVLGCPDCPQLTYVSASDTCVTPFNDVYPDVTKSGLYYNPGFLRYDNLPSRAPDDQVIVDSDIPDPGTEDRIEMLKYTSMSGNSILAVSNNNYQIDAVIPDHYVATYSLFGSNDFVQKFAETYVIPTGTDLRRIAAMSQVDWAPLLYLAETNGSGKYQYSPNVVGDLNYFTDVDRDYLRDIIDFSALALYDMR